MLSPNEIKQKALSPLPFLEVSQVGFELIRAGTYEETVAEAKSLLRLPVASGVIGVEAFNLEPNASIDRKTVWTVVKASFAQKDIKTVLEIIPNASPSTVKALVEPKCLRVYEESGVGQENNLLIAALFPGMEALQVSKFNGQVSQEKIAAMWLATISTVLSMTYLLDHPFINPYKLSPPADKLNLRATEHTLVRTGAKTIGLLSQGKLPIYSSANL